MGDLFKPDFLDDREIELLFDNNICGLAIIFL